MCDARCLYGPHVYLLRDDTPGRPLVVGRHDVQTGDVVVDQGVQFPFPEHVVVPVMGSGAPDRRAVQRCRAGRVRPRVDAGVRFKGGHR